MNTGELYSKQLRIHFPDIRRLMPNVHLFMSPRWQDSREVGRQRIYNGEQWQYSCLSANIPSKWMDNSRERPNGQIIFKWVTFCTCAKKNNSSCQSFSCHKEMFMFNVQNLRTTRKMVCLCIKKRKTLQTVQWYSGFRLWFNRPGVAVSGVHALATGGSAA